MSDKRREQDKIHYSSHGAVEHPPMEYDHIGAEHGGVDYERRDVSTKTVFIYTFVILFLLIGFITMVHEFYIQTMEATVQEQVLTQSNEALRMLHEQEAEILNNYKIIDSEKGIYQIPIDRAMDILAAEAAAEAGKK